MLIEDYKEAKNPNLITAQGYFNVLNGVANHFSGPNNTTKEMVYNLKSLFYTHMIDHWEYDQKHSLNGYYHIFYNPKIDLKNPINIISCHIDNCYSKGKTFAKLVNKNTIIGTLDNQLNIALISYMAFKNIIGTNTVIIFTDREETGMLGAKRLAEDIKAYMIFESSSDEIQINNIITLDCTTPMPRRPEKDYFSSIENYNLNGIVLAESCIKDEFNKDNICKIKKSLPDESYIYQTHLNRLLTTGVFSLCTPIYPRNNVDYNGKFYMHHDRGTVTYWENIKHTINFLKKLLNY